MIICDDCLMKRESVNPTYSPHCAIDHRYLWNEDGHNIPSKNYCPLRSIELKDGTVFVPEEMK